MEIKKSKGANLENHRLTYLLMGFVFALSAIYVCFEYTDKEIEIYNNQTVAEIIEEDIQIDQTIQEETPPPPPEPEEIPDVIEEIKVVEDDVKVENVDFNSEDKKDEVVVFHEMPKVVDEPQEEVEEVFIVVEEQAEYPGGQSALMKYFSDNIRYPVSASENGVQGRVICQFTVWKDGSISDIKILRSVHPALDNEAIRLIKGMPKWKPGKQLGKPVASRFTLPVLFRLQ